MKNSIVSLIITTCIVVAIGLLAIVLVGSFKEYITSVCVVKVPQDVLPGWSDNRLEFGESYRVLTLFDVLGEVDSIKDI